MTGFGTVSSDVPEVVLAMTHVMFPVALSPESKTP